MSALALAGLAALTFSDALQAAEECRPCHPQEVSEYLRTGMGRSITRPSSDHQTGVYFHGHSATTFRTEQPGGKLLQTISRGGTESTYAIDYLIGSGNAAVGYLSLVGDALFQSPVTYYTARNTWGMAPGMEQYRDPDFTRPATAECLWCHAGRPRPIAKSVNRYETPAIEHAAISCDRCHGSAASHLESPRSSTIFNPATATPRKRDSVCEQCHLSGLVRVLNPGRTFGSFEPRQRLEEFWTVFVGATQGTGEGSRFQVVSHVEQLALSACAQQSGDSFWCGTCHDPHFLPEDPIRDFSGKCMDCHAGGLDADHATLTADCLTCHMPKRQSHDSGHSAFTDHRIARNPSSGPNLAQPSRLKPWKAPSGSLGPRNSGIANIRYAQTGPSAATLDEGVALLREALPAFRSDPGTLEALGTGLMLSGSVQQGLQLLEQAVEKEPLEPLYRNQLGAAWWELGETDKAIDAIDEAIRQEPLLESSYHMLARIHLAMERRQDARNVWLELLKKRPRLLFPRKQLKILAAE